MQENQLYAPAVIFLPPRTGESDNAETNSYLTPPPCDKAVSIGPNHADLVDWASTSFQSKLKRSRASIYSLMWPAYLPQLLARALSCSSFGGSKREVVIREVVKIRYRHRGSLFEEKSNYCPYCGASFQVPRGFLVSLADFHVRSQMGSLPISPVSWCGHPNLNRHRRGVFRRRRAPRYPHTQNSNYDANRGFKLRPSNPLLCHSRKAPKVSNPERPTSMLAF